MKTILISFIAVMLSELFLAAVLTLLPRLGSVGKTVSDKLARAPTLDVVVALLTWVPWLIAGVAGGWLGLLGSVAWSGGGDASVDEDARVFPS